MRDSKIKKYFLHLLLFVGILLSSTQVKTNYTTYEMGLNLKFWNAIILIGLEIVGLFCIATLKKKKSDFTVLFKNKLVYFGFIMLDITATFSICASSLFYGEAQDAWSCSFLDVIIFAIFSIWIVPFLLRGLLFIFDTKSINKKRYVWEQQLTEKRFWVLVFIVSVTIWMLWLLACNPANTSPDTFTMLDEATGVTELTTWFSVAYILCMKVCYTIIPHISFMAVVQIIALAALNASFFSWFRKKWNANTGILIGSCLLVILLPANALMVTTVLSNTAYGICVLWGIYFLMRLIDDPSDSISVGAVIGFSCSLAGVFLFRNEGVVVAALFYVVIVVIALIYKNRKMMAVTLLSVLIICLFRGPIYNYYDVKSTTAGAAAGTSVDIILATVFFDGTLSDDLLKYLEDYESIEEWKNFYQEYAMDNTDARYRYLVDNESIMKWGIETAIRNPGIAIRERLTHTSFVWEILEPEGGHHSRCIRKLLPENNQYGYERKTNILTQLLPNGLYLATVMFCVADSICYRGAFSIILCLLMIIALCRKKDFMKIWVFLPLMGIVITQLLAQTWQGYRHIWPLTFGTIYVAIHMICCTKKIENEEQ